jgi:hypothetical protein
MEVSTKMSDVNKLSERVIEYAERASAVADAAQGKKSIRSRGMGRWLLLPAAGAGLYAIARTKTLSRQAKVAMQEAKTRAAELPDELMGRVRQTSKPASGAASSRNGATRRRQASTTRRKTTRARASR